MKTTTFMFRKVFVPFYLSLLLVAFQSARAEALLIEIEPDAFNVGTNLTHLFRGITLQTFYNGPNRDSPPTFENVYATSFSSQSPTGTMVFGNGRGGANFYFGNSAAACWSSGLSSTFCSERGSEPIFGAMIVTFDRPTNYFRIMANMYSDPAEIYAYGLTNQLVGSCTYFGCSGGAASSMHRDAYGGFSGSLTVGNMASDSSPLIQTLIIGGHEGSIRLDRISYSVPEPSTLLLMLLGFGSLVLIRRPKGTFILN